ncbi:hypothetical protein CALVIDRAFT_208734 [Calocera viscosa TUFC12733]|uniref:Uncharacterized protein n=1 Tax=Calocera viscosa (strain TUFC12733) TaxID=1330018 RepID=A0A167RAF5_CALVF|nr:hypothetical protein CALVIDRAFT_208734 [Calocera viscosa TUFC12733]
MFTRQLARSAARPLRSTRLLSTTPSARADTLASSVKETARAVDKAAGRTLASGIESAQSATESVKEALGAGASQAKDEVPKKVQEGKEKLSQAQRGAERVKKGVEEGV